MHRDSPLVLRSLNLVPLATTKPTIWTCLVQASYSFPKTKHFMSFYAF